MSHGAPSHGEFDMSLDLLAFGAHPDDAEIWCGGLLLKLKDRGYRTGIVHLTVGEMGSSGTPEVRRQELMAAAHALRLLDGQPHAVSDIFYYLFPHDLPPTFVVDISDYVDPWAEALQCHRSQFYNPSTQRYEAIDRFLAVARARGFARGIGYAQAFIAREPLH